MFSVFFCFAYKCAIIMAAAAGRSLVNELRETTKIQRDLKKIKKNKRFKYITLASYLISSPFIIISYYNTKEFNHKHISLSWNIEYLKMKTKTPIYKKCQRNAYITICCSCLEKIYQIRFVISQIDIEKFFAVRDLADTHTLFNFHK